MSRLQRACGAAAVGTALLTAVGCGNDPPAPKAVSQDGQALPEGKTADLTNLPKPKGGRVAK